MTKKDAQRVCNIRYAGVCRGYNNILTHTYVAFCIIVGVIYACLQVWLFSGA